MKTFDVRYAGLVHALLRGISSDRACSIDPQTACSLIPEMLRSGDEMLTGDCVELTTCLDAGQCRQLAESILRHVGLRQMTLMEQNVLANILDELSRSGGVLGKESCEILDRNSCVYNGRLLMPAWAIWCRCGCGRSFPWRSAARCWPGWSGSIRPCMMTLRLR